MMLDINLLKKIKMKMKEIQNNILLKQIKKFILLKKKKKIMKMQIMKIKGKIMIKDIIGDIELVISQMNKKLKLLSHIIDIEENSKNNKT